MKPTKNVLTATDAFDSLQTALDKSRDLLGFAPVPGLSAALAALLAIGDQIKKMKSNGDMVKAISQQIGKLNDVVDKVVRQVENRAERLQMKPEQRRDMLECFQAPGGWHERVEGLGEELGKLLKKAQPCADGPWYRRLIRSTRDEETLRTLCTDLTGVIQHFLLAGGISIEALTEQNLALVEAMHGDIKMLSATQKAGAIKQEHECIRQQAERERMIIEAIPHANNAGFKAAGNADKGSYLAGTRGAVFDRLEEWVSSEKPVCFLVGAAGMGKSTIASEFCRRHERELGSSFFFRRGDPSVGSTAAFFSTIAYQLAHSRKELRPHIVRGAERHIQAGNSQQMQYVVADLLHNPLRSAKNAGLHSRVYVVVDALDECTESSEQPDLIPECLRLLLSCALQHSWCIRLLITSRPEPNYIGNAIRREPQLKDCSVLLSLYDVEGRPAIDHDIRQIIRTRLCAVQEGAEWYQRDPTVVTRLTEQSEGVFVYARTAVDFIVRAAGIAQMEHRLGLLLTPGNTYGLGNLDLLYRTVLETAFPPADLDPVTRDQIRLMLAWVALCQYRYGLTPARIEMVSGISCRQSIPILAKLRSVLVFNLETHDASQTRFRAMHVTFRDFLTDAARCGADYHVDPQRMHARLAVDCLTCMRNNPRRDLVYGSKNGVIYPVFNWMDHVVQASPTEELVGLLKEMFTASSTDRAALEVFFCRERFSKYGGGTSLLCWVDLHIGRDLSKTMGERMCLVNEKLTLNCGAEIQVTTQRSSSPDAPAAHKAQKRRDMSHSRGHGGTGSPLSQSQQSQGRRGPSNRPQESDSRTMHGPLSARSRTRWSHREHASPGVSRGGTWKGVNGATGPPRYFE